VKLRVLDNTIRLRVTKSELTHVAEHGWVESAVQFGGGAALIYRLESGPADAPAAGFANGRIVVTLPAGRVAHWAATDEISISGAQALDGGAALEILVEKDFECLEPRPGEDPRDLFDNPKKSGSQV
jgi:hypothetical protein